ncbi:hypothetical protein NDU88_001212 [Pleurodeles waltl]|uniref:Uncharacterized protein n=1 Tax=Pleurodeles waltl TaxID=8319 RepID=A0AAV7TH56_PLEWA|nr:hypothetical protein NDU88_001212 [Pleurodeles waltl]
MSDAYTRISDRACKLILLKHPLRGPTAGCLSRRGAADPVAVPRGPVGAVIEKRPWSAPCTRPEPWLRAEPSVRRGRRAEAVAGPRGCRGGLCRAGGHPRA